MKHADHHSPTPSTDPRPTQPCPAQPSLAQPAQPCSAQPRPDQPSPQPSPITGRMGAAEMGQAGRTWAGDWDFELPALLGGGRLIRPQGQGGWGGLG